MSDSEKAISEKTQQEKLRSADQVLADEAAYLKTQEGPCLDASRTFGMAFSGGGIRSATFGLGVLQGLAQQNLLKKMKYISTVSGGGYVGGWPISWIHRAPEKLKEVEQKLGDYQSNRDFDQAPEPKQINFLREYSNYMTPRVGIFGADTWAGIATYLRNVLLNQVILVALLGAALLVPWWVGSLMIYLATLLEKFSDRDRHTGAAVAAAIAAALLLYAIGWASSQVALCSLPVAQDEESKSADETRVTRAVALPLIASAAFTLIALWLFRRAGLQPLWYWFIAGGGAYGLAHLIGLGFRIKICRKPGQPSTPVPQPSAQNVRETSEKAKEAISDREVAMPPGGVLTKWQKVGIPLSAVGAGAVGGLLVWLSNQLVDCWRAWGADSGGSWHAVGGGPPILMLSFLLVGGLQIGLLKLLITPEEQEWWSRLGGLLLRGILIWAAIFALAIFAPYLADLGAAFAKTKLTLILGWAASTVFGLLSGKSSKTSGKQGASSGWEVAALVSPYIFVLGLLVLLSVGAHRLAVWSSDAAAMKYWDGVVQISPCATFLEMLALAALAFGLAYRVDINIFSMNLLYRNRLVRCYLGASRIDGRRKPNRFTGFDPADDPFLTDFDNDRVRKLWAEHPEWWPGPKAPYYDGPYPIVCAALNVTHGDRLAWQERKAKSFVFTPKYCGFDFPEMKYEQDDEKTAKVNARATAAGIKTVPAKAAGTNTENEKEEPPCGFRDTETYAYPKSAHTALHAERGGVHLGTAMSISGAAASPNMGFHTSPPLAFLMTVFDVRMGWWLPNSRYSNKELQTTTPDGGPPCALLYLLKELAASTTDKSKYVYLSDGGHFENLAVYELVRRRVKYIIACDGDADVEMKFGDLGNCIRKCRSDFGVEITLDPGAIKPNKNSNLGDVHGVLGTIVYPHTEKEEGFTGNILYIKPTITKNVPRDVLAYREEHLEFPDQTTADQWFDESQFESYRRLGQYSFQAIWDDGQRKTPNIKDFFNAISPKSEDLSTTEANPS